MSPRTIPAAEMVRLPALGLSTSTMILFAAGAFFGGAGIALKYAIFAKPFHVNCPAWFLHGFCWTFILVGLFVLFWSVVEMFRRFEFSADADQIQRTIILGPLRWRRSWPRREIAGTTLRAARGEATVGEGYSRLMLVLSAGWPIPLLPQRYTSALIPIDAGIRRLLFPDAPTPSPDEPPLGGGLVVSDSPDAFRITAGPIAPSMVSGIYFAAAGFVFMDNFVAVPATIALWVRIRNEPIFWFAMVGQWLTVMIGAFAVRRWIRGIAERHYEITIDQSRVTIRITSGAGIATQEYKISDVRDVRSTAVVSSGEGSHKRPEIVRLELVTKSGKPAEILFGRPPEESQWVLNRIGARLCIGNGFAAGSA